jgi:hypothetical protein
MAMPTALRGDANSVAVLGTYKPDAALSKSAYTAWATEVCNGFTATYWSNSYAAAAAPIMERAESTQQIHLSSGKLTFECVRK